MAHSETYYGSTCFFNDTAIKVDILDEDGRYIIIFYDTSVSREDPKSIILELRDEEAEHFITNMAALYKFIGVQEEYNKRKLEESLRFSHYREMLDEQAR